MRKLEWFLALAALASCSKTTAPDGILLTGSWGSDQGFLSANQVSTQFTGTCGRGNTSRPIMLDKTGQFDIAGIFGATGQTMTAARFVGIVGDRQLTLRVLRPDASEVVHPVTLALGQKPTLATCH